MSNNRIRVSETFLSLEGEGMLAGAPTFFVRTYGCNLTCSKFNNPEGLPITFEKTLDLSNAKFDRGCDTPYAWHPAFKQNTTTYSIEEMAQHILDNMGQARVVSFTGGEPLLWASQIAKVIHLVSDKVDCLFLIETNGTKPIPEDFPDVVFAISPKLSNSGEQDKLDPEATKTLMGWSHTHLFKFVCDGSDENLEEVHAFLASVGFGTEDARTQPLQVYLMPEGSTPEQQLEVQSKVVAQCLKHGFSFSQRLHLQLFGNTVGT